MNIETFLTRCVERGDFPGASWIVGREGEELERGVVGALGRGLGPVSLDTLYDIASLTKILVTYALMQQVQEGLVCLEDTLDTFLPLYQGHEKGGITLFELLTHTSVIPGQLPLYRHAHSREDLLAAIRWQLPRADSPARVAYTSKGYILLGEVIAAIDGASLDSVVQRRVLKPLGMAQTLFNPSEHLLPRIAPTEECPWRGRIVRGQVHDENAVVMGGICGHAGIFSTAPDIARAAAIMLGGVTMDGVRFFAPDILRIMTKNYTPGRGENRGLGFQMAGPGTAAGDFMSTSSFGHTGFTGTSLWVCPKKGIYAVLLTNRIHPNRNNVGIFRARQIFHNLSVLLCAKS